MFRSLSRRFSTKIHVVVDLRGRPLFVTLTPGQRHETTVAQQLIEHAQGRAFLADTAYDSSELIQQLDERGMQVVICQHPRRKTGRRPLPSRAVPQALSRRAMLPSPQTLPRTRHPLRKDRPSLPLSTPPRLRPPVAQLGDGPQALPLGTLLAHFRVPTLEVFSFLHGATSRHPRKCRVSQIHVPNVHGGATGLACPRPAMAIIDTGNSALSVDGACVRVGTSRHALRDAVSQ